MALATRKQIEISRRESDVLAIAADLFDSDDWPSVTMDQIAAKAGVSKGTLYNHFASKDDVYGRLLHGFSTRIMNRLDALDSSQPVEGLVRAYLGVLWDAYREAPNFRRISHVCEREGFRAALSEGLRRDLGRLDARFLAFTRHIVERGVAERRFGGASVDAMLVGGSLVLAGLSRFVWSSRTRPSLKDPQFNSLCQFILAGLGSRAA